MFKTLVSCLVVIAAAEDLTGSPFHWPDMLRNGGRVVQVLTHNKTGRPEEWNYPKWYKKYPMRFVEEVPTPPGSQIASGELVVLEYDIADKMSHGSDKFSPKHNELGLIAKDTTGKELGRYVFSFWPIGNDEVEDLSKDQRQRPREHNGKLVTKNRAVTSVELSKAYTWWGLPKNTKQIHLSNLNRQGFDRVIQAVKDYSENHPYFNDYEITLPDGKVKMPAVTGNSLIEYVVDQATHQRAFEDGLSKMGYLALNVDKRKAGKFNPVPTEHVLQLINHKAFKPHYNKDLYIVPAYYDATGNPLPAQTKSELPEQWYVVWTSGVNWRQNYMKAEKFQGTTGIKQGASAGMNMRQVDGPLEFDEAGVAHAERKHSQAKKSPKVSKFLALGKKAKKNPLEKPQKK